MSAVLRDTADDLGTKDDFYVQNAPFLLTYLLRLEALLYFSLAVVISFYIGYFNFSFLLILMLIYFVYKIDNNSLEKSLKLKLLDVSSMSTPASLPLVPSAPGTNNAIIVSHSSLRSKNISRSSTLPLSKSHPPLRRTPTISNAISSSNHLPPSITTNSLSLENEPVETCFWFNILFKELWRNIHRSTAETMQEKLKTLFESNLNEKKLPYIESVKVCYLFLGDDAPNFNGMTCTRPDFPDCRFDFDIVYYSREAKILLEVIIDGNFFKFRLPISIEDFHLQGRMRFDMTFFRKYPYLHMLSYAFLELPTIDLAVRPFQAFDLLNIPFAKAWILDSLKTLVRSTMVLPEIISVPYHHMFNVSDAFCATDVNSVKQDDINKHTSEIEKSLKDGDFGGLLHVRLLEARKLLTEHMGARSVPYCILSTGAHEVFTTKTAKRCRHPIWNEFFELLVKKQLDRKMELTVMARDTVNGDDFLGMSRVDFSSFGTEMKDLWIPLERVNKKNREHTAAGEVHLQIRYVPDHKAYSTPETQVPVPIQQQSTSL